jgi:uncharacterized protein (UPF0333 family)
MALVETIRQLWQRKLLVGVVLVVAIAAAIFSSYRISSGGLESRSLAVAAASSQILVDSPDSTLVQGAELGTFEALATRAKIYGQYLASLAARKEISKLSGVPARAIATSGPFSSATGQTAYSSQTSEERAGELLQEGAQNRLVFTAQEGVPILTVDAQSASSDTAIALASASFKTLENYVEADGKPVRQGVTVRELGAPEGGTLGGSNNMILMVLAFFLVFLLGCAAILLVPTFAQRWRALDDVEYADAELGHGHHATPVDLHNAPHGYDPTPLANGEPRDHIAPHAAPSR